LKPLFRTYQGVCFETSSASDTDLECSIGEQLVSPSVSVHESRPRRRRRCRPQHVHVTAPRI